MPVLSFTVDRREAGKTLASVLKRRYNISWAQSKRLIEARHIRVSGHVETDVARRLKVGKAVSIAAGAIDVKSNQTHKPKPKPKATATPKPKSSAAPKKKAAAVADTTPRLPPEVLVYVDDAIVVVNKPAGLTTMRHAEEAAEFGERGKRFLTKTLADLLPALLGAPTKPVRAVHRLDRDTSGLVVFARTPASAKNLTSQFRKHTIERRYQALTRGIPAAGRIESTLIRNRGDDRRGSARKADAPGGKKAVTFVKVIEELGDFALVECRLETGRTHQVRIHLGEAGTPLCGERVYDREVNRKPLPDGSEASRPMLHAAKLGIKHPETGDAMKWETPPPHDFALLLETLRKGKSQT